MRSRVLAAAVLAASLCLIARPSPAQEDAAALVGRLEAGDSKPGYWDAVARLEAMGREVLPDVSEGLRRASPYARIGCAKVLFSLGKKTDAVAALLRIALADDLKAGALAANLLANLTQGASDYGDADDVAKQLKKRLGETTDGAARVALARALASVTGGVDMTPSRALRELLRSADPEVQAQAALAQAEMKEFRKDVVDVLQRVAREPGERGRLAAADLAVKALIDEANGDSTRRAFGGGKYALLDEILDTLRRQYVDPDKLKEQDLIEAAAKGMASALDPYTGYLDEKEFKELFANVHQKYGGIGARVAMRKDPAGNAWLTIERPIYSGPAYKAGLRSMDRIVDIEGQPSVNRELGDLVERLKGDPGTLVKFKVYRRGWKEPKEFELIRQLIKIDITPHEMLPGDIGYLHLTTFGEDTAARTEEALKDMEAKGAKGLVLDLRGNSGGLLRAAVDVAEKFLPKGSLVVSVRSRGDATEKYLTRNDPHPPIPLIVLIDGGSASASEILAGALQDHHRATCVGERSFGKGSVQQIPELKSTPAADALRLTIAKYFLPSNRSPQKEKDAQTWGIEPDVKVEAAERDYWLDAAVEKIRQAGKVDDYLKEHLPQHKDLFRNLAEDDGADPARYPDLAKLLESLDPPLNRKMDVSDLREVVRDALRRWAADERGRDFTFDFQLDLGLQRGILEVLKKAGIEARSIPAYAAFAAKAAAAESSAAGTAPAGDKGATEKAR